MKKFIIERNLPGAGNLTPDELAGITQTSCSVVSKPGEAYHWIQSFVTEDKIYCIHIADNADVVREHAKRGGFPANSISEVKAVIDPSTR